MYQEVSVVDALLTIYRQQNEKVRKAFLARIYQEDSSLDIPGMRTREEMMEVSRERMKDIVADGWLAEEDIYKNVNKE